MQTMIKQVMKHFYLQEYRYYEITKKDRSHPVFFLIKFENGLTYLNLRFKETTSESKLVDLT